MPRGLALSRFWRWALRACALANALPLFVTRYLPFCDLPEHVAVIATLRHWFDPEWRFQKYYVLAFDRSQCFAYHIIGALLAVPLGSAENGNLALLALVAVAYPYAARTLLRSFGRDERLAIFACSAFWSRSLVVGFLPYVASVPVAIYALALVARQAKAPTRRRAVGLGALSFLVFFLHPNAFILLIACAPVLMLVLPRARFASRDLLRELLRLPTKLVWLAPASALALLWTMRERVAVRGKSLSDQDQLWFAPLGELPHEFPVWAHDVWRSHVDEWLAIATWVLLGVLVVQRGVRETTWRVLVSWTPFAAAVALFAVLPFQLGAGAMVNVRFAVFFPILALLVIRPSPGLRGSLPMIGAMVVSLVTAANAAVEMRLASRAEVGDFGRLIDEPKQGTRLVSLVFHATSEFSAFPAWVHLGSLHRARHGGIAAASFSDLPHWPVQYRDDTAPPAKVAFWEFDPCLYRNAIDGDYYDYVLVRGTLDPFRDDPPGPRWRVIDREKDWTLYEKIRGTWNPSWAAEDRGPCESRRSVEAEVDTKRP